MKKVKQSFTLVEILVVIVIIGILSSFIFFTVNDSVEKANLAKTKMFEEAIRNNLLMNLVSEWKLDGDANDSWGDNNGTMHNFSADPWKSESECISGQCLEFDGSDDYINVGNFSEQGISDPSLYNNLSLSIWTNIKTDAMYIISSGGQKDGARGFSISNQGGSPHIILKNGIKRWEINPIWNYDKWINIVFSWNGNHLYYYENGILTGEEQVTNSIQSDGYSILTIGCPNNTFSDYFFKGTLDEVKIYNAAIPESQIKQEYLAGLNNLYAKGLISQIEYNEKINNLSQK